MTAQQVLDLVNAVKWPIVVLVLALLFMRRRRGEKQARSGREVP